MQYRIHAVIKKLTGWTTLSVNRQILAASFTVGFASVLVKSVSFVKEIFVAFYFGTDRALDVFIMAMALPAFGISVLGGAIQSAFIPTYLEVLHRDGRGAASSLLGSVTIIYGGLLIGLSVILVFTARWLLPMVASGFTSVELAETIHVFYWLIAVLVVTGVARLYSALLAAEHRFALPTLATSTTPICTIAVMLAAYAQLGIYALVSAAISGAIFELLIMIIAMRRMSVMPYFGQLRLTFDLRQVISQFFPLIAGTILMAGTTITDQIMAAMLPSGSVAALSYGNKLPAVTIMLISGAIGTAVLPYFSRMIAARDWSAAKATYKTFIRMAFITSLPLALLLIGLSRLIIQIVFQHGAFTSADTTTVSEVQMCLLLEIPFYIVAILAVRMITAMKKTLILVWGAAISLVLNVALNYILMRIWGVAGIALSTSVVYFVSMLYLLYMAGRLLKAENMSRISPGA
ncbi:MAG: polysaccharide biosynthesis C-terminal domain-containing protein [Gammaproteobacteria bacterium]|nr:polysaccharide biosynthesis C-terminal domain-containing protein [Gammaproteobacteria bacterium]